MLTIQIQLFKAINLWVMSKNFEYKRLLKDFNEPEDKFFIRMNKEGWELISIIPVNDYSYAYYFKQEIINHPESKKEYKNPEQ